MVWVEEGGEILNKGFDGEGRRWEGGVWGKIILRKGDDQLGMIYGIGIGILVKEITFL